MSKTILLSQSSISRSVSENSLATSIGSQRPLIRVSARRPYGDGSTIEAEEVVKYRVTDRENTRNGPSSSLVQERSGSDASRASAHGPLAGLSSFVTATPRAAAANVSYLLSIVTKFRHSR